MYMYIRMYVCTYIHINCISSFCFSRFSRLSLTHIFLSLSLSHFSSHFLSIYFFLSRARSLFPSLPQSLYLSRMRSLCLSFPLSLFSHLSLCLSLLLSYFHSLSFSLSLSLSLWSLYVCIHTKLGKNFSHPHLSGFSFVQPFTRFLRCLISDAAATVNLPSFQTVCLKHVHSGTSLTRGNPTQ